MRNIARFGSIDTERAVKLNWPVSLCATEQGNLSASRVVGQR
jgi:hypothetical protein